MRILYHAPIDLSLRQGHAVHVRRLVEALEERGHDVHLLSLARPDDDWPVPRGGWTRVARETLPKWGHLSLELRSHQELRRLLREFSPEILLVRQEAFALAPLGLRRRIPLVVESNALLSAFGRLAQRPGLRARAVAWIERALLREADAVGAVSTGVRHALLGRYGLDPARLLVVPNGAWVPPLSEEKAVRQELGVSADTFVAAFIGNLSNVQGIDTVIEALAMGSPGGSAEGAERTVFECWIIGEGTERRRLEELARERLRPGVVRFFGGRREEEATRMASAAQILLAPYDAPAFNAYGGDDSSLKVLQGLACDRPLLVSAMPGTERVESLGAGERIPSSDAGAWRAALSHWNARWIEAGRPLRDWPWRSGSGPGRAYVASERTWGHTAARWEEIFDLAVRAAHPRSASGSSDRTATGR